MTSFVGDRNLNYPYSSVVYIETTFPSGQSFIGSGAVIGENDVLTASHVVYSDINGSLAQEIEVYPARDGSSMPFGSYQGAHANYFEVDQDNDGLLSRAESEYDLAVVGFETAFGNDTGWFELEPGQSSGSYNLTGYPVENGDFSNPRMTNDYGYVTENPDFDVFDFQSIEPLPGSSGSPLWSTGEEGLSIAGVLSTRGWAVDVSARYSGILDWVEANDFLLETDMPPVSVDHQLAAFVQELYIGFFGRPADPEGQSYWAERIDAGDGAGLVLKSFAAFGEALDIVFSDPESGEANTNQELVQAIYHNLFARDADEAGQQFYVLGLESGAFALQSIVLNVIDGARGSDLTALQNKVQAAQYFTDRVSQELYDSDDIQQAREFLAGVDKSPASVTAAKDRADGLILDMHEEATQTQAEAGLAGSALIKNDAVWLDAGLGTGPADEDIGLRPGEFSAREDLDANLGLMGLAGFYPEADFGIGCHI